MNTKIGDKIEMMRNGEKIKCPRCKDGFISVVGNPDTSNVFKCSHCQTGIVITVPLKIND